MTRGRPKKDTTAITFRLNIDIKSKLMSINPSLCTSEVGTNKIKFRHGALGRYLERLINEDISKRQETIQKNSEKTVEDFFGLGELHNATNKDQDQ